MINTIRQWRRNLLFKFRLRPIDSVFRRLKKKGLSSFDNGLEVFGYTGEYHTQNYKHLVNDLHVWEIDEKCEAALKRNLPGASIKITDSFKEIQRTDFKFDLLVIDNPSSIYGDYCEHFEILPLSFRVLKNKATLIINVVHDVKAIYAKYKNYEEDRQNGVRSDFYKIEDATGLDKGFILEFYKRFCKLNGFETEFSFLIRRNNMVSYLVMHLNKVQ